MEEKLYEYINFLRSENHTIGCELEDTKKICQQWENNYRYCKEELIKTQENLKQAVDLIKTLQNEINNFKKII